MNVVNLINVQEQENLFPSSLGTTGWSGYRGNLGIQEGLDTGEPWYTGGVDTGGILVYTGGVDTGGNPGIQGSGYRG